MSSSELSRPGPAVVEAAVDAAEQARAHQQRELPLLVEAADAVAAMRFRHFADRQLSHGFHSCHGPQRFTTTTRPMR